MYFKRGDGGDIVLLINVHVDDGGYGVDCQKTRDHFLSFLNKRLTIKDLGELNDILGVQLKRNPDGTCILHQGHYIEMMGHRHGIEPALRPSTPLPAGWTIPVDEPTDDDLLFLQGQDASYLQLVGEINWVAQTRYDIAFAAGMLARANSRPTKVTYTMALRVIKYLVNTSDRGLLIRRATPDSMCYGRIVTYCDADFAGCLRTRRSTTGVMVFFCGCLVGWSSKLQSTVALATAESEYIARASAAQLTMYFRQFAESIGFVQDKPSKLLTDNKACMQLATNDLIKSKLRHLDIKLHFYREKEGIEIVTRFVGTLRQCADMMTKSLPDATLLFLINLVEKHVDGYANTTMPIEGGVLGSGS